MIVEGYPPPDDERLRHFVVTPDPGVIEINIHPSESWPELVSRTEAIAAHADELGLASEKFDMSGRHLGHRRRQPRDARRGHAVRQPAAAPPELLRSMLTYWQHHPSLSYLFSGQFIGPTSQAPRVDEARHEALYELEIAFAEMDRLAEFGPPPLWQVDRLLRNLLTDLTGNTHRAEFCIDKLYNPESSSGRLGVLELRGFEMPPHHRMSLVQALLIRALVARLWAHPYAGRLVRWGNRLHDEFMLPWFLERDLQLVLDDLRRHGFGFDSEWFEPFTWFRFPRVGRITKAGVTLELREAIEPWHVLGEQLAAAATARYVDSSVQRLQLRGRWLRRGSARGAVQRLPGAAVGHRHGRHRRRRDPLPRLLAAVGAAPDDRRAGAADVRARRPAQRPLARRLPLSRRPPRRPRLRPAPGQRGRG